MTLSSRLRVRRGLNVTRRRRWKLNGDRKAWKEPEGTLRNLKQLEPRDDSDSRAPDGPQGSLTRLYGTPSQPQHSSMELIDSKNTWKGNDKSAPQGRHRNNRNAPYAHLLEKWQKKSGICEFSEHEFEGENPYCLKIGVVLRSLPGARLFLFGNPVRVCPHDRGKEG
ncbi:hypothetical protein C8R42DRAFT_647032 [Lentinula raphanica]|nr:hypothetical protein C8R42DRAFT_647032 [Lentinula raphanica]